MIRDRRAYERWTAEERGRELAAMSPEESIRVMEALLTSELMDIAEFGDDDHPLSLAIALGIAPKPDEPATAE